MIKQPAYLKKGDKVAIVCPAKKLPKSIAPAIAILNDWGLEVIVGDTVTASFNQFAGDDALRTADLQRYLDDPEIKAVIAGRGGYGTLRIIDEINFTKFVTSPKWIVGFSDITVLLSHVYARYGIQSIHGQMPYTFEDSTPDALASLKKALFGEELEYNVKQTGNVGFQTSSHESHSTVIEKETISIENHPGNIENSLGRMGNDPGSIGNDPGKIENHNVNYENQTGNAGNNASNIHNLTSTIANQNGTIETIVNNTESRVGEAEGILIGGNLTLLAMLQGSDSEMDYRDKILFIEDVGEHEYSIDRLIRMLKRNGKLSQLKGLIVGAFNGFEVEDIPFGASPETVIWELVKEYNYPVCFNFPVGHIDDNRAMILGRTVIFKVTKETAELKFC